MKKIIKKLKSRAVIGSSQARGSNTLILRIA